MPLVAVNLDEARTAYASLELRATVAEGVATNLRATIDSLNISQTTLADRANLLAQFTANQAQANAQLTTQQAGQVSPDVSLDNFISSLGLSVALGESSMPDRTVTSVAASLQGYMTFSPGADGLPKIGLRFYQPELGQPTALATTSFEIAKVPPQPGVAAPRSLYLVLADKQSAYSDPFWAQFVTGSPAVQPAAEIIVEISKLFTNIGAWSLPFLVQEAGAIAALETTLSGLVGASAPPERVAAYAGVVQAFSNLVTALDPTTRSQYVAGDLYALSAAMDATTRIAQTLHL